MNTPHVPMDAAHLKKYAANAAREIRLGRTVSCSALSRGLKADLKKVCRARESLNCWSASQTSLPGAAEWLLDNHYLALREGERARAALKGGRPLRAVGRGSTVSGGCCGRYPIWTRTGWKFIWRAFSRCVP